LRSVTDGKIFDRISVIEERYSNGRRSNPIEVFRLNRQLQSIIAGRKLRVLADDHFCLVWTVDNWQTTHRTESRTMGVAGHFADMETGSGKAGKAIFTLAWRDYWEGRNFEVLLEPA
jgi:glucoamylase